MKKPGFLEGVLVALLVSTAGSIVYQLLSRSYTDVTTWRFLIVFVSAVYGFYLLKRSHRYGGRLITCVFWLLMLLAAWFYVPAIREFVLMNVVSVWLLRSLYFHDNVISVLLDLGLNLFSLAVSLWAFVQTDSISLSLWCLFLVQALFPVIPGNCFNKEKNHENNRDSKYQHALQIAEAAMETLSSNQK
ncbi:MAG TPA: hypothetical protein ENJ32_05390 [Crenotrichaceae bacterium]|nr:hypothetical protein [Crenotrichaceae bacterium]